MDIMYNMSNYYVDHATGRVLSREPAEQSAVPLADGSLPTPGPLAAAGAAALAVFGLGIAVHAWRKAVGRRGTP